jgi:4-alpha-glucanotransferase
MLCRPFWVRQFAQCRATLRVERTSQYALQEDVWRSNALRTLPVLMGATDMMVCGEDLGMIPACVHPVMERLGLLGKILPIRLVSVHSGCAPDTKQQGPWPHPQCDSLTSRLVLGLRLCRPEDTAHAVRGWPGVW